MRIPPALCTALAAATGVLLAAAAPARAERITLKNGWEIEGWIVEESKAEVVVAIIKHGSVGKLTIDPANIEEIDRTRKESLEQALERYKREQAALDAARLAKIQQAQAAAATQTAEVAATPKPAAQPQPATPPGAEEPLVPPPTAEEAERIQQGIDGIGDTRRAGGAATRRDNAVKSLIEVGKPAIPALTTALGDANWYRRMNAARALAGIAEVEKQLKIYREAVPALLKLLSDSTPFVRIAANAALEAISGQKMGFEEPKTEELQPSELAVIDRWSKWWEAAQQGLPK